MISISHVTLSYSVHEAVLECHLSLCHHPSHCMVEPDVLMLQVSTRLSMGSIQMLTQLQHITDDACMREHLLHSALALTSTLLGKDAHAEKVQVSCLGCFDSTTCKCMPFCYVVLFLLATFECRSPQQGMASSEHCTSELTHSPA